MATRQLPRRSPLASPLSGSPHRSRSSQIRSAEKTTDLSGLAPGYNSGLRRGAWSIAYSGASSSGMHRAYRASAMHRERRTWLADYVAEDADALDFNFNDVSRFEQADSRGGARQDDVAGQQRERL